MPKLSLKKNRISKILPITGGIMGFILFSRVLVQKVNVLRPLEFEHTSYNVAVQHGSQCTTGTLSCLDSNT